MAPKMQYVRLGNSGLKVSKIILGCMSYGSPNWQGWVLPEEEAIQHIKFAYDNGITSFDTANAILQLTLCNLQVYSNGLSEVILGNAIKKLNLPRDELVIMTKVYAPIRKSYDTSPHTAGPPEEEGIINQKGLSRKHIFDSVQASLKRLQLDHIDLLQCHRFDYDTSIEETMQALHDVVQAGWVRYVGMSSCWAYQFHQMQNYAITHNLTPFISMQNHYSLLYREEEREMFPTLKMFGVGSIPWSPLGRGVLTHPIDVKTTRSGTDKFLGMYNAAWLPDLVGRVEEIAKKKSASMAQIALAWTFAKPGVTAPIIGTTSLANLEDILGSLEVNLTEEEVKYLEEPYKPIATTGHT
ncbi:Aldo/keto reductase [Epithele typhae]|uniref:Aldo/keto reductase n=1 Tax=Epithele typhae TaxID=378194 RepID=UPI0020089F47|nr:Aldo/keto reductase [Epithele typhae]KAH9934547.1 Aldo/keto reductase [Epithele typhae]